MDQFGSLHMSWSSGYSGAPVHFVDDNTICFVNGSCIKFINILDGQSYYLQSPGDCVGVLATNPSYRCFAFSDYGLESTIYVYMAQNLDLPFASLKGGARLSYCSINFANNGSIIASCSGVPEVKVTIWNWKESIQLCSFSVVNSEPFAQLLFNPLNWRQLSGIASKALFVWQIEQINEKHHLVEKCCTFPYASVGFPSHLDATVMDGCLNPTHQTHPASSGVSHLDLSSGFVEAASNLCSLTSHCWVPDGQIICGCSDGQLFVADADSLQVTVLYRPESKNSSCESDQMPYLTDGCFQCLALHKNGLFAAGKDGVLRCLKIDNNEVSITYCQPVDKPVTSLCFSPNFMKLVASCSTGSMVVHDIWKSLTEIFDDGFGDVIGLSCLSGGNQHCVTVRSNGLVQGWIIGTGKPCGRLVVNRKLCSLVCAASSSAAFVGTEDGALLVLDIAKLDQPRCVTERLLHKGPLSCLQCDDMGQLIVTGSSDGHLFVLNAYPSSGFNVVGYTTVTGYVMCISCISVPEDKSTGPWLIHAGVSSSGQQQACNQLVELCIDKALLEVPLAEYMDSTRLFKDTSVKKRTYLLRTFIYDFAALSNSIGFGIIDNGKGVAKFTFSENEASTTNLVIDASYSYIGHGLGGSKIKSSCHRKWLLTGASDGYVILRAVGAMNNPFMVHVGNYRTGGISQVCFTGDGQKVLALHKDGTLSCWEWKYSPLGKTKAVGAVDSFRSKVSLLSGSKRKEDSVLLQMKAYDLSSEIPQGTWLEKAVIAARTEEDRNHAEKKNQIRKEFQALRDEILGMIDANGQVSDIEKLDRQEFVLDIEERQALISEREKNLKTLRNEKELSNLGKQYMLELIKDECWNKMAVKWRCIAAFQLPIEVSNYPLCERTKEELDELAHSSRQRELEVLEEKVRLDTLKSDLVVYPSLTESAAPDTEEDSPEYELGARHLNPSTYGSLGFAYGGSNALLQSQFTLSTSRQERHQIALLKDCICSIKKKFNKQFDEVCKARDSEMKRMRERNARIVKIAKELELAERTLTFPVEDKYQPETLLEVRDDEVTVEKYVGEEEQKKLEEISRQAGERRLAEDADNSRNRALDQMMGGRLETNFEEELKKELQPPVFMSKPQSEWSEEELKLAKEFEKMKETLCEEREKYRKVLEAELRKLQATNLEGAASFDEKLQALFQTRVKTEMVICQEELKILRLAASILTEEELDSREQELLSSLEKKKVEKQQTTLLLGDARREVDAFKDAYELLLADDKTLDRTFRREFSDLDTNTVDALYRLFKRRPRAQKSLKAASDGQTAALSIDGSPFQQRPSSSRAASAAAASLELAMTELDQEIHMPDNVTPEMWAKLVLVRRQKVEKEQQVKAKALVLASMNAFLQRQVDKEEKLKLDIEKTLQDIQTLRESRLNVSQNLEVQLLLKQGQVELSVVDMVPDFSDSVLIHRSAVEELNTVIKALGESKLQSMRESKDFRKGIHLLEWELKELFMRAEDAQSTARDLQLLRVTKDLQAYLGDSDHQAKRQQEILTLEKTIKVYKEMHAKKVEERKRVIRRLQHQIRSKQRENERLDIELEEVSLSLLERKDINDTLTDKSSEDNAVKRMEDIITRRKLVDLAKAQAHEIAILRAEVERLRMRTFPALVQLDPR